MNVSLSSLVDNLSEINKKESDNKFIDNMRSTMASLSQSVDKVSDIDKKVSQIDNRRSMTASLSHPLIKYQRLIQK